MKLILNIGEGLKDLFPFPVTIQINPDIGTVSITGICEDDISTITSLFQKHYPNIQVITSKKKKMTNNSPKSKRKTADALMETFGFAFDKLDPSRPIQEQAETFVTDLDLPHNDLWVPCLVAAVELGANKIKYNPLSLHLQKSTHPNITMKNIESMQKTLRTWKHYPKFINMFPNFTVLYIFKAFASKLDE